MLEFLRLSVFGVHQLGGLSLLLKQPMLRGPVTEERGAVLVVFDSKTHFVAGLAKLVALPGVQAEITLHCRL